jgi:hypothetical protein
VGWAGDARDDARAFYDEGLAAVEAGDAASAARAFARADALQPSAVALTSALRAAIEAGAATLAMELAERSAARAPETEQQRDHGAAARDARDRFGATTARLTVSCAEGHRCSAMLDGELALDQPHWLGVGPHRLAVTIDDVASERVLDVRGGERVALVLEPAPSSGNTIAPPSPANVSAPPPMDASGPVADAGLSPAWLLVGVGVTALLGTGAIISAVDTRDRHDTFSATGRGAGDGEASQLRTNVLFFSALAAGVGTAAVAVFAVDWRGDDARAAQLVLRPTALAVEGSW